MSLARRAPALVLACLLTAPAARAHVVFAAPETYADPQRRLEIDLSPQKDTYLQLGERAYRRSADAARRMQAEIGRFLEAPSPAALAAARRSWSQAREIYGQTEAFRFNEGPIDAPPAPDRPAGPELRINAWPVDEATIDYVSGAARGGLVNDLDVELTLDAINARDQVADESAVTTGWHAIEFLLWGQDLSASGPGNRSHRDYLPGDAIRDRRRTYLRLVTQQLVDDLATVASQWAPEGPYRRQLELTAPVEVVGRALHGATSLVAIELYGERLSVALDSGTQEDEHSCFSDTTHLDLRDGLRGVANLLRGEFGGERLGSGVIDVVAFRDPALGQRLVRALDAATAGVAAMPTPFDQLILRPPGHPDRRQAEATVDQLLELARAMKASAETLGIRIVVPGV